MKQKRFLTFFVVFGLLVNLNTGSFCEAASEITSQLKNTIDKVIGIVTDEGMENDKEGRRIALRNAIDERFNYSQMVMRSLAKNWEFSRIAKTDLALLRIAAFEILYRLDVPPAVVIDEALELAKTFSTENSRKFLNGILDKLLQDQGRPAREASVECPGQASGRDRLISLRFQFQQKNREGREVQL